MTDMRNIELSAAEMILVPASKHWGMILTLGILMIVLGTVGFFQPMVYTVATVVFFGALLLVAGGTGSLRLSNFGVGRAWSVPPCWRAFFSSPA
jgi:uncharacterized membrane protein HdeD (DUF308 family)